MERKDLKKFGSYMSVLQKTFSQDKPISDKKTEIYFEILMDIPIENIEMAIKELMRKKVYPIFPLPSEIRKAAGFDEDEDIELKAIEAFRKACKLVGYTDPGIKIDSQDHLIERVIYLCFGGWTEFAMGDKKDDRWDRKYFVEIYSKLFKNDQRDNLLSEAKLKKELLENRESMKTLEEKK